MSDKAFGDKIYNAINMIEGVVFECGANDGHSGSPSEHLENKHGYTRILADANPHCNERNENVIFAALSDCVRNATLTIPLWGRYKNCGMGASIAHGREAWGVGKDFEEITVTTTTYSLLMEKIEVEHVDVVIWDVEGHGYECVKGMEGGPMPKCMVVENDNEDNLKELLKELNYEIVNSHVDNWICIRRDK